MFRKSYIIWNLVPQRVLQSVRELSTANRMCCDSWDIIPRKAPSVLTCNDTQRNPKETAMPGIGDLIDGELLPFKERERAVPRNCAHMWWRVKLHRTEWGHEIHPSLKGINSEMEVTQMNISSGNETSTDASVKRFSNVGWNNYCYKSQLQWALLSRIGLLRSSRNRKSTK